MTTQPAKHLRVRFGALLKQYRLDRGMTQLAVGRRYKVTKDAVGTWERGRSIPAEPVARGLDQLLQAGGEIYRAWREANTQADKTTEGSVALSADTLLASSAQAAAEFGTWAEIVNAGAVTITTLNHRALALFGLALTRPPEEVIAEAAQISHTLFGILRGHHKPAHAKELFAITGKVNAVLSWLSGDVGNLDAARIHGATSRTCAEMADDPEVGAWASVVLSKAAFWDKNYPLAVNIAAAADSEAAARSAPGTVRVMLACQQADGWAKLGAVRETTAALEAAERARETATVSHAFDGLFSCGPGRALNYTAACSNEIGRHAQAQAAADAALAVFAADPVYGFGTVGQTHVSKTLAYANAGDLDAAAAAARPVLDLPPERHLATLAGRLAPLANALRSPSMRSSSVAGPLGEEIAAFCANSRQRAIGAGAIGGAR
jgi:transcriptional regulator with XRE-family HTH domain